jgi:uncharacterized protein (DUF58 family)
MGAATDETAVSRRAPVLTGAGVVALIAGVVPFQLRATTGSRWLTTLAALIVVAVIADGVVSWITLRRVRLHALAPADGRVGEPGQVVVTVTAPKAPVTVRSAIDTTSDPVVCDERGRASMTVIPHRRGVFHHAVFEVRTDAPLGLAGASRRVRVALPAAAFVAPALGTADVDISVHLHTSAGSEVDGGVRPSLHGSDVVGVRPYLPGDPLRRVHWATTARTGDEHVRLSSPPRDETARLVVDLGDEAGEPAERIASDLMATGAALLRAHVRLTVVSREGDAVVDAPVHDVVGLGRRLAAATCGPPIEEASPRRGTVR